MQYFQAVQIGKQRANKAQMVLFDISGFAMLTLTTKRLMENLFRLEKNHLLPRLKLVMVLS
uniref:Uncharacterized protein n=1 Tax=uncultured marine thaumarchaeote SAT1000_08_G06 TaxID=1456365 RepID=A0A075I0Q9_9ARCH|nr:hypothetical protein [uncultured marine thaumarchaeote SAT1000_08_G06]